jgi:tetratricopeptide (TPR) repeat protein
VTGPLLVGTGPGGKIIITLGARKWERSLLFGLPAGDTTALAVEELLRFRAFGDELSGEQQSAVAEYGRSLWSWLVDGVDSHLVAEFLTQPSPTIGIYRSSVLRRFRWELLNAAATGEAPDWLALRCMIHHVDAGGTNRVVTEPAAPALLLTARPYLDDDIPADIPISAIANACHEAGHLPPLWLPGVNEGTLRTLSLGIERRVALHLDMHGVQIEAAGSDTIGALPAPHVLLESEFGGMPKTVGELLDDIGGAQPAALLVTSCEAENTEVPFPDTVHGQAMAHGIETVVVSRRRLTPDEVACFSAAFHQALASGGCVADAVLRGRRALHETSLQAGTRRIGGYCWASFVVHVLGIEDGGLPAPAQVRAHPYPDADGELPPPVPAPLMLPFTGGRVAVIQVCGQNDVAMWETRLRWWSQVLAHHPRVVRLPSSASMDAAQDVLLQAPDSLASAHSPLVRVHDWTMHTRPEDVLRLVSDGGACAQGCEGLFARSLRDGVLDAVFVLCAPAWVTTETLDPAITRHTLPDDMSASAGSGASELARWLSGEQCPSSSGAVSEQFAEALAAQPEAAIDAVLDTMLGMIACEPGRLLAGLRSVSGGFLRHATCGVAEWQDVCHALNAFAMTAWQAGLAQRHVAGQFTLDIFDPRLVNAIRCRVMRERPSVSTPWLDWVFRVDASTPELHYDPMPGASLPDFQTLGDRIHAPDRLFGAQLACVTARNWAFFAIAEARQRSGRQPQPWAELWEAATEVDRRWTDAIASAIRMTIPAPKPSAGSADAAGQGVDIFVINRDGTARAADSELAAAIEASMVQVDRQTQAELASLILGNGPGPGAGVTQSRQLSNSLVAALLLTTGEVTADDLGRIVGMYRWPEDRGHVFLDAGANMASLNRSRQAIAFLDEAFSIYLTCPGAHSAGHAIEICVRRAQVYRRLGDHDAQIKNISLAKRLVTDDWPSYIRHVSALILELGRLGDDDALLALTARLLRTAPARFSADPDLLRLRCLALIRADRYRDAEQLMDAIDISALHPRTRSIIELLRVGCLFESGREGEALAVCDSLLTYASNTVLADAYYQRGRILLALGKQEAAVENDRAGSRVADGAENADRCGVRLSRILLQRGDHEECAAEARRLRETAPYPVSAQAGTIETAVAALSGKSDGELRELLRLATWRVWGEEHVILGAAMAGAHKSELLLAAVEQSQAETTNWILGAESEVPGQLRVSRSEYVNDLFNHTASFDTLVRSGDPWEIVKAYVPWLQRTADALWDQGKLEAARTFFLASIKGFEGRDDTRDRDAYYGMIRAARSAATLSRRLSNLDDAIRYAKLACQYSDDASVLWPGDRALTEEQQLSLDTLGNSYYDRREYRSSYRYHCLAVLNAVRMSGRTASVDEVLDAASNAVPPRWGIVHCLANYSNSALELGLTEECFSSRAVACEVAAKRPSLAADVRRPERLSVLRLLSESFPDPFPFPDNPIGLALERVRHVLPGELTIEPELRENGDVTGNDHIRSAPPAGPNEDTEPRSLLPIIEKGRLKPDNGGFAHYIDKSAVQPEVAGRVAAIALCGWTWIPQATRDSSLPVCPRCRDAYETLPDG